MLMGHRPGNSRESKAAGIQETVRVVMVEMMKVMNG